MYLDVPPSFRYTGLSGTAMYFHVLSCIVMYRVTGKDGIRELEIRVNAGIYQYMLVHTSTYQYIPVHTVSY